MTISLDTSVDVITKQQELALQALGPNKSVYTNNGIANATK